MDHQLQTAYASFRRLYGLKLKALAHELEETTLMDLIGSPSEQHGTNIVALIHQQVLELLASHTPAIAPSGAL